LYPGLIIYGQEVQKPGIGRGSIESQMNYIIYQSEKIDDLRMVKSWWLGNVKNQITDTLVMLHDSIAGLKYSLKSSNESVDSLQTMMNVINEELTDVTKEKNSISFLGIPMNKTFYNSIMWFIIGVLLLMLFIFIIMFKRSNVLTVKHKKDLQETRDEFEAFRKKALVREQQIVRDMYDEVLKYKNKAK
jgi:hypothetical protein